LPFKRFDVLGLLAALALVLTACSGAARTQAYPGLTTDGELVFLAEAQFVRAVDVTKQSQRWQFPAVPDNRKYGVFVATPAIGDDLIVVASEGPPGSYSGAVFGLDRATGAQRWCLIFDQKAATRMNGECRQAAVPAPNNPLGIAAVDNRIIGGLTFYDGHVYFGMTNGRVYAVDAATGQDLWFAQSQRDVWSAPVVDEATVYFGSLDHHLYAVDRATGQPRWTKDFGASLAGTPTLHDGRFYVGTFASKLYALDAANGEEIWHFDTRNWVWDGPAVGDDLLYFTDVGGTVYALDPASGQQRWAQTPGGSMRARPAAVGAALYAGDHNGRLYALKAADGTNLWEPKTLAGGGQLLVTPVLLGDFVVVAPFSGKNLLEVYHTNGDFYWPFAPG
jgi:outer membrane protein assembly factor BamB